MLRLVLEENIAIDRILVVTFTKAATAELRERVLSLPDFDDDPEKSNEPILEAILQCWIDER